MPLGLFNYVTYSWGVDSRSQQPYAYDNNEAKEQDQEKPTNAPSKSACWKKQG